MITTFYTRKLIMKKELMIFTGIFLFLAIGMHFKEWTSHPVEHFKALPEAGAYGIGLWLDLRLRAERIMYVKER